MKEGKKKIPTESLEKIRRLAAACAGKYLHPLFKKHTEITSSPLGSVSRYLEVQRLNCAVMDSPFDAPDLDKVRESWPVCVFVRVETRYTIGHSIMPYPEDAHLKRGRDSGYQSTATQTGGGGGGEALEGGGRKKPSVRRL